MSRASGTAVTSVSGASARRQAGTSDAPLQWAPATTVAPNFRASLFVCTVQPPLSMSAAEKSPAASGEPINAQVSNAPADWPKSSTRAGSPPKARMFRCTQPRAKISIEQPVVAGRPVRALRGELGIERKPAACRR